MGLHSVRSSKCAVSRHAAKQECDDYQNVHAVGARILSWIYCYILLKPCHVVEKNVDSSSRSNPLRRRGKITTRRREGVGVVVEKKKKVDELSTKIRVIYLQQ